MYKYVFTKKMKMEFKLEDSLVEQGDAFTKAVTDIDAEESYLDKNQNDPLNPSDDFKEVTSEVNIEAGKIINLKIRRI
jgi:hypothetical protein